MWLCWCGWPDTYLTAAHHTTLRERERDRKAEWEKEREKQHHRIQRVAHILAWVQQAAQKPTQVSLLPAVAASSHSTHRVKSSHGGQSKHKRSQSVTLRKKPYLTHRPTEVSALPLKWTKPAGAELNCFKKIRDFQCKWVRTKKASVRAILFLYLMCMCSD